MKTLSLLLVLCLCISLSACGNKSDEEQVKEGEKSLEKVIVIMDWYPQPEHGGFYQALATGLYEKAGLDVEIRSGGGIRDVRPIVAIGQVNFAVGTSDTTLIGISRGLPLVPLAPYFLHDPQCVMSHPELNIKSLEDLDNKVVMMHPTLSHADYMAKIMKINLKLIPVDYSISRFATDKSFVQQCFLTSEPIHLAEQGIYPDVIPLSDSGFDPYRHILTSQKYLENSPETVKKFIKATTEGWKDFVTNDPSPALAAIAEANPQQELRLMHLALEAMKKYKLVQGYSDKGEIAGKYQVKRLEAQISSLKELELIDPSIDYISKFPQNLLPEAYQ